MVLSNNNLKKIELPMSRIFVSIMFLSISSFAFAGGGWTQPKGSGYFKLSEWWVVADQHYTLNNQIDPNTTTALYNTSFYGEYGITNKFTAILYAPILSRAVINNTVSATTGDVIKAGDAINAPGDVDFTFKYAMFQSSAVSIAASVTLGIPLGEKAGGQEGNLQTGDGEFNQIFRIDAGIPIAGNESFSAYGNIYGGFNKRSGGFSDEVRYGVELGAGILDQKLWFTARYDVIKSRNNKPSGAIEGSFFANNSEVSSVTGELSYFINKKIGVSASYGTAVSGKIIYAAPSYSFGVFLKV